MADDDLRDKLLLRRSRRIAIMLLANSITRMTAIATPMGCTRLALFVLLTCQAVVALAEDQAQGTCVEVEIDGERSLSIECLNERLWPETSHSPAAPPTLASEATALTPSNQLGLFNRAALSNRMGANFGKSAQPQRPAEAFRPQPLLEGR